MVEDSESEHQRRSTRLLKLSAGIVLIRGAPAPPPAVPGKTSLVRLANLLAFRPTLDPVFGEYSRGIHIAAAVRHATCFAYARGRFRPLLVRSVL